MTETVEWVWTVATRPGAVLLHLAWWFSWVFLMWTLGADLW